MVVASSATEHELLLPYILNDDVPFFLGHPWVQVDGVAPDKPLDSATLSCLKQFSAMTMIKMEHSLKTSFNKFVKSLA